MQAPQSKGSRIVIKLKTCGQTLTLSEDGITQVLTYASLQSTLPLLRGAELEGTNPRLPKRTKGVKAIIETLHASPTRYCAMSKGIMFICTHIQADGDSLNLKPLGIFDGGHNALALISYLTQSAPKDWASAQSILASKTDAEMFGNGELLVPLRFIHSTDAEALKDICTAQNTSMAVKGGSIDAMFGMFDTLRTHLPSELDERVRWSQNGQGAMDVDDFIRILMVAFKAIPSLSDSIRLTQMYSSKKPTREQVTRILRDRQDDPMVQSALKLASTLARLFDHIQRLVPAEYNNAGGKFGGLKSAKSATAKTAFYGHDIEYKVPVAFVFPIFATAHLLLEVRGDSELAFKIDPFSFMDALVPYCMKAMFKEKIATKTPSVIGKCPDTYQTLDTFAKLLLSQLN